VLHASFTIPITTEHLGPYTIDPSVLNPETPVDIVISQPIDFAGNETLGPFPFGFEWQQSPGFFNSSTLPSSGLFNSGGVGNSGLQNVGTLESGWANLGNFMSGVYNTSVLDLTQQAFVSGLGNFGAQLSGVLNSGTGP
jgi:hypothetical protein